MSPRGLNISTRKDHFEAKVAKIEARDGYLRPAAFAIGYVTYQGSVPISCHYPVPNCGENYGMAAVLAGVTEYLDGAVTLPLTDAEIIDAMVMLEPFRPEWDEGDGSQHANMSALWAARHVDPEIILDDWATSGASEMFAAKRYRAPVVTFIQDLAQRPGDIYDAYLRLHLLSARKVKPHELNLYGLFGLLPNLAWTNHGPFLAENFDHQVRLPALTAGQMITVQSVDKFPPMLNCVLPGDIRIADAARVRLGAYLGKGTTVMQEGFINFSAGTEGPAMVEGRLSAGVFVGANSDIGGGSSTMGTLSGGNDVVVSTGDDCLLEAESGLGIPIGDRVRVEAGFYLKSTMPVYVVESDEWVDELGRHYQGTSVKAEQLCGISDAIFRRNAVSGQVEVIARGNRIWGKLNPVLHNN